MVPTPAELLLSSVSKRYDETVAVAALDLRVEPGTLVSLLGPSGCGKTTTLRMVAGFEIPDGGRIEIGGRDVTALPPHRRNLGMVFQNYSLFPHRTVAENIAFGVRMAGASKREQGETVTRMLEMVRLQGRADMFPSQLSGGQQQRIALARSLAVNPQVLLLDEPLGALDKALREEMQFEIREMQQRLGITTLLVTHDQEEAMSMSDAIAVMKDGQVLQIGSPTDVYDRPGTRFVATFLGTSNLVEGMVTADGMALATPGGQVALPAPQTAGLRRMLSVRPERVRLGAEAETLPTRFAARVAAVMFRGSYAVCQLDLPGVERGFVAYRQADGAVLQVGESITAGWRAEDSVIVDIA